MIWKPEAGPMHSQACMVVNFEYVCNAPQFQKVWVLVSACMAHATWLHEGTTVSCFRNELWTQLIALLITIASKQCGIYQHKSCNLYNELISSQILYLHRFCFFIPLIGSSYSIFMIMRKQEDKVTPIFPFVFFSLYRASANSATRYKTESFQIGYQWHDLEKLESLASVDSRYQVNW